MEWEKIGAIIFVIVMLGYIIYATGYAEGHKDSKEGVDKHPEDNKRF